MSGLEYEVSNRWGSGRVGEEEARKVFATYGNEPGQHIDGDLETGFTAWVESELGGLLMATRYEPVPDTA
jgi:hypothetical protein